MREEFNLDDYHRTWLDFLNYIVCINTPLIGYNGENFSELVGLFCLFIDTFSKFLFWCKFNGLMAFKRNRYVWVQASQGPDKRLNYSEDNFVNFVPKYILLVHMEIASVRQFPWVPTRLCFGAKIKKKSQIIMSTFTLSRVWENHYISSYNYQGYRLSGLILL